MSRRRVRCRALRVLIPLVALAMLLPTGAASGGSLRVDPVVIALSAEQRTATILVENSGNEVALIHAQLTAWTQEDGVDRYAASRELLVSPPVFELAPGAQQIVRIGLRQAAVERSERAYRLFIQEVPQPETQQTGMRVMLRLGVPIFVAADATGSARVSWRCHRDGKGMRLEAHNDGSRHERIVAIQVLDATSLTVLDERRELLYLLPSATRRLDFNPLTAERVAAGAKLAVRSFARADEAKADVALAAPCS